MTTTEQLREALGTKEGRHRYVRFIGEAQACGIKAYQAAKAAGVKEYEARQQGERSKDETLLALLADGGAA